MAIIEGFRVQNFRVLKDVTSFRSPVELTDSRKLGIATLGSLKEHPRIAKFRRFLESWYLSYFFPDAARSLPMAGPQKHLNIHGDNLGNVVQFMERDHKKKFQTILNRIDEKIPGIKTIDTKKTEDGRLLLRFNDKGLGHFPKNLKGVTNPSQRILLDRLPRILRGYGRSFQNIGNRSKINRHSIGGNQ